MHDVSSFFPENFMFSFSLSLQIGELLNLQSSSFVTNSEKQLYRARTVGPSLRVDKVEISTVNDDPSYKKIGRKILFFI